MTADALPTLATRHRGVGGRVESEQGRRECKAEAKQQASGNESARS